MLRHPDSEGHFDIFPSVAPFQVSCRDNHARLGLRSSISVGRTWTWTSNFARETERAGARPLDRCKLLLSDLSSSAEYTIIFERSDD
jgi:hypothetical protein